MRFAVLLVNLFWAFSASGIAAEKPRTLALHPENPHYLLFRGKPTVLITSGEHYGAVLNADFDYHRYLDVQAASGFNLTRTFSGTYCETTKSFHIENNTLAPLKPEKFVCPWARSGTPGAGDGGAKFDLDQWNPVYFARLKDFLREASRRGIVVELSLFCTMYDEPDVWAVNPMNAANNVNGVGNVARTEVLTLKEPALTKVQENFVRKIAAELADFDNLYYEICNEPYIAGGSREWTAHIAQTLRSAETSLKAPHLIAENIANGSAEVRDPLPEVSILNFHYATPPDAVAVNWHLNRVISDDETGYGFKDRTDANFRREAWEFILAGGAIYNGLDFSFSPAHPDGTLKFSKSPGGGSPALRQQLAILKKFIEGFDFIHMHANRDEIRAVGGHVHALAQEGKAYAIYLRGTGDAKLSIAAPKGKYHAEWINTKNGRTVKAETIDHASDLIRLAAPPYEDDVALRVRRMD